MSLTLDPRRLLYKTATIVALLIAGIVGKKCYDDSVVEKAALAAKLVHLREQADSLDIALAMSNLRVKHDTVVLNRAVTSYVTLRDTINIRDTVQVKVALERCDSVVAAVGPTIASLTVGIKTRDATIVNRDSVISVLNARFPSKKAQIVNDAKWALIGTAADELYHAFKRSR